MVKKSTKAIFKNGGYMGEYDWEGGIPLSKGEMVTVLREAEKLSYILTEKEVIFQDKGQDQSVQINYYFEISS